MAHSLLLLSGCQLPARDNPIDPVNAPVAEIHVIDHTDEEGNCAAVSGSGAFPEIVSASRGRCLALDARQTESPKDHDLELVFEILDESGTVLETRLDEDHSQVAVLEPGFLRTLPFDDELLTARVSATDNSLDRTVEATTTFRIENAAPILVVDRPRTLAVGGLPWALGEDYQVPFSIAGSYDPDGDPLHVVFTFPGEAPEPFDDVDADAGRVTTHAVPSGEHGSYAVQVELYDGPAGSLRSAARPDRTVVRLHEPDPWMHHSGDGGTVSRLDGTRFLFLNPTIEGISVENSHRGSIGGFTRRGQDPILVIRDPNVGQAVQAVSWPGGQQEASFPFGTGTDSGAGIGVGENGEIWRVGAGGATRFNRLQIAQGGVTISQIAVGPGALLGDGTMIGAVDLAGDFWATALEDDGYVVASVSGSTVDEARYDLIGRSVLWIERRPTMNEMWMLDDAALGGDPRLRRFTSPGVQTDDDEIAHVDAEGNVTAHRRQMKVGAAAAEPIPPLRAFRPSPDGTHAWAIEGTDDFVTGRVLFFNLQLEVMPTVVVLDAPPLFSPVILGAPTMPILEPTSPDGHEAWILRWDVAGNSAAIMVLGTDGTMTALPAGVGLITERAMGGIPNVRAAANARSNTLCVAAWDMGAGELRFRRLHRNGNVDVFTTSQIPLTTEGLMAVGASSDASNDYCWVAWSEGTPLSAEFRGYVNADAISERSVSIPGVEADAMLPYAGETLWITTFDDTDDTSRNYRQDFTPASRLTDLGIIRTEFSGPRRRPAYLSSEAPIQKYNFP